MPYTDHNVYSDILGLEKVIQQTGILHAKSILIDCLREIFRRDRYFAFKTDRFGFPLTPSHLGLDPDAGLDDTDTTRIYIGGTYRYDVKFNPSVIVRNTGSRYVPISFNQDLMSVIYTTERLVDEDGEETLIRSPYAYTLVGAWDQTFEIKVIAEDPSDREEITDIIMVALQGTRRLELQREGVAIRSISSSGETEEQYANDWLYSISINVDVRSEWKVQIPISDVCERIGFCLTFDSIDTDTSADNLTVNFSTDFSS